MSNHYNNKSDDNTKIQDFYNSRNQMGGINIIDQRGFCTRNSEEAKIKKESSDFELLFIKVNYVNFQIEYCDPVLLSSDF